MRAAALVTILVALTLAPAASAQPASIGTSVAASIASEIVKSGIKAGVAEWAPSLTKYVDPVSHGLGQVQAQLQQLDAKVTELQQHQAAFAAQYGCTSQTGLLTDQVANSQSWLKTLTYATQLPTPEGRQSRLQRLFTEKLEDMQSDQIKIHSVLMGEHGAILACARNIETQLNPYVTYQLAQAVHDFYATYENAAVAILTVRVNLMALHPQEYSDAEVKQEARTVEHYLTTERALIKPHFPKTVSYDSSSHTLWQVESIPQGRAAERQQLQQSGWHVTGHATIPTCSAIYAFMRANERFRTRYTGETLRQALAGNYVLNAPRWISCYDDHDKLHDFNVDEGRYEHYGYAYAGITLPPSLAARQNNGLYAIGRYSYLHP